MSVNYDVTMFRNLLASTLREHPDSEVVQQLFGSYPSLRQLLFATEQELRYIKGIGPAKAKQILSALELARMPVPEESVTKIQSPQDVFAMMKNMQLLDQEHFVLVGLSTKNQVVFKETVTIGTLNSSLIHPRECFRPLIRHNCAAGILVHNHPSGDPTPSQEDRSVTRRLIDAGSLIGIAILDHVIIGRTFISMREKGLL